MTSRHPRTVTHARAVVAVLSFLALPALPLLAQDTGRIVGRVIDAGSGIGLSDVGVQLVGTTAGTSTGVDGRFTITNIPAGTVTLQARRIGFAAKTVTGLIVDAGQTLEQDISLSPAAVTLTAQVVTAAAERGSVTAALDQQKNATGVVNGITQEQIARSPDGDAAQAVQRVSGVTVQDGKYVFVRGLGERYTTASLNGVRLPSPEPERRVVPLDIFPAGLLQSVTASKTFTPDQPGDFSGAQVDIRTREFPAQRVVTYSASVGANDAATGRSVLTAPTVGTEWLGFGGSDRAIPGMLAGRSSLAGFTRADVNQAARSLRNVWSAEQQSGLPNYAFSASVGGDDPIFGRRIGYLGSLTYSASQEVQADQRTALARGTQSGTTEAFNEFAGSTGRASILWGGLLNLSTNLGQRSRISLDNTYNRTSDNEARRDAGFLENESVNAERTTLRFVERSVRSNQLRGEHVLGERNNLDWLVSNSGVTRREPDRADLVYVRLTDPSTGAVLPPTLLTGSNESARRLFGDLTESTWNLALNDRLTFGEPARGSYLKAGASYRRTSRDARNDAFSIFSTGAAELPRDVRELPAEQIFDGRFTHDGDDYFTVQPFSGGGSYGASDDLVAGYLMSEYALTDRVHLVGGARVESWRLDLTTEPVFGAAVKTSRNNIDLLPSLAVNFRVTGSQNLRLSASQTLARPEYRELSPLLYVNVIGAERGFGNPALRRTLIQNADARWEWYPSPGEIFSLGVFAKRFEDPIERVTVATSGTQQFTYVNADGASSYGVELEARKGLGGIAERLTPLTAFTNVTLMRSDIRPGAGTFATLTNAERPMVGQAPYVVNAGLTYTSASGATSATALYNVVGKRVHSAGSLPLPDVYEQPRNILDLSLRFPLVGMLSGKLDARNLLDAPYELTQGSVMRETYRLGRIYSLGLSWRL